MNLEKKGCRLYNIIFPIWMLWLFPVTWIIVLPANFGIDLLVTVICFKLMHVEGIKDKLKKRIWAIWGFGFLADFIGTAVMFIPNLIDGNVWWINNIANPVCFNPFENIYSFLWATGCVLISGICIYFLNSRIALKNTGLEDSRIKRTALALAVFTAPYLFYLPTAWFY